MKKIVSLSEQKRKEAYLQSGVDGFLFGSLFSLRFHYSREEFEEIVQFCDENHLEKYVAIDAFLMEEDLEKLEEYYAFLKKFSIDGIYFNDLSNIYVAKKYGLSNLLIFDPDTIMTNSIDSSFLMNQGIKVVLAREITLEEIKKIFEKIDKVDMQVFGHCKMSSSKRKFLTNYFHYLKKDIEVSNQRNFKLVEENRDFSFPIMEDEYGTRTYTDYVFSALKELDTLENHIERAIFDDTFLSCDVVVDAIEVYTKKKNTLEDFYQKYPELTFSTGYFYQKTNKTKDE